MVANFGYILHTFYSIKWTCVRLCICASGYRTRDASFRGKWCALHCPSVESSFYSKRTTTQPQHAVSRCSSSFTERRFDAPVRKQWVNFILRHLPCISMDLFYRTNTSKPCALRYFACSNSFRFTSSDCYEALKISHIYMHTYKHRK